MAGLPGGILAFSGRLLLKGDGSSGHLFMDCEPMLASFFTVSKSSVAVGDGALYSISGALDFLVGVYWRTCRIFSPG